VAIQANECTFPGWRDVAGARTTANGSWQVRFGAGDQIGVTKTSFRARWRGAVSPSVLVQTRPGVQLTQSTARRWSVGMLAQRSFLDRRGYLQRFDRRASRWRTIASFRFREKVRVPAGSWSYARVRRRVARGTQVRAYVPRSQVRPCYLAGYSLIQTAR
jgi:hypothetical protein